MAAARDVTIRLQFTTPSLGGCKQPDGSFHFAKRNGQVVFPPTLYLASLRFVVQGLGRYFSEIEQIGWDPLVDGRLLPNRWHQVWYSKNGRSKFCVHEAFLAEQIVAINCQAPEAISDEALWLLMQRVGQYRGLSPYKPGQHGHFSVVEILPRCQVLVQDSDGAVEAPPA